MVGQNISVKHSALYDNTLSHSIYLCIGGIHTVYPSFSSGKCFEN
ncbi:hypothetical protein SARI_00731 [Salmonella enterica subsp. arizonae serovar 62:z4,z23:-]|uniref:Uncharacterized protein n=1 Tax=Salmonella arizonae (strain ATCC BAA-731 / CDC346-86 / RSK2980) TaxID=41514 RepID=A9MKT9_SALAR|nr:hypothetical protein SARI_00731 [Salmonella enterica subsp. arizonae serovar 62:z4,z23:-]